LRLNDVNFREPSASHAKAFDKYQFFVGNPALEKADDNTGKIPFILIVAVKPFLAEDRLINPLQHFHLFRLPSRIRTYQGFLLPWLEAYVVRG
jgi:hypothetical protein